VASASGVQSPGQEVYRLCSWACYRIKFLDRYRGLTCVLFNMWQMAALNLELFHRCRLRQLTPMFQATWAVSRPSGPWPCAGRPACYRLAHGHPTGVPGSPAYRAACVDWHRETTLILGWVLDQYSTRLRNNTRTNTSRRHTDTLGLRNGPVKWPQRCGLLSKPTL